MAGRTGAKRHIHKYFRLFSDQLWHCGDARCSHFMPGNMPIPVWKDSICWNCNRIFELTPDNMKIDDPICESCAGKRSDVTIDDDVLEEFLAEKMNPTPVVKHASIVERKKEDDIVESEDIHSDNCEIHTTGICNCM